MLFFSLTYVNSITNLALVTKYFNFKELGLKNVNFCTLLFYKYQERNILMFYINDSTIKFLINKPSFGAKKDESFGVKKIVSQQTNSLVRVPNKDVVEISQVNSKKNNETQKILADYEKVKQENLLGDEITIMLAPKKDVDGSLSFSKEQSKLIKLAVKKIDFFKNIAQELEKEGSENVEQILKQTKKLFGGERELGKYVKARECNGCPVSKDSTSIYNKLIKEFRSESIEGKVLDSISIPHFKKPYKLLDKLEKAILKEYAGQDDIQALIDSKTLTSVLKTTPKEHKEAINSIKDLIGLRLVLPDNIPMKEVEKYLTNAILSGDLDVRKVSNYHSTHIYPYINNDTLTLWQQSVPNLHVVRSSDIKKRNGYTTTQMNIKFKIKDKHKKVKEFWGELQIRSNSTNKLGQVEHLIYDIIQGKDIGKGIPELQTFYDSTGIVKAVKEVFGDPKKENAYIEYEKTTYATTRNYEKNKKAQKDNDVNYPLLADFGLGEYEVLSFESLEHIDKKAKMIFNKYSKNE